MLIYECVVPRKGARPLAQGCTPQAGYPGCDSNAISTPTGLRPPDSAGLGATPLGSEPFVLFSPQGRSPMAANPGLVGATPLG